MTARREEPPRHNRIEYVFDRRLTGIGDPRQIEMLVGLDNQFQMLCSFFNHDLPVR
jgi:hypothetical protein